MADTGRTIPHVPLVLIEIPSIYPTDVPKEQRKNLPARFAQCTPDTKRAIGQIVQALRQIGGALYLSDMFRSYEMQYQANNDYVTGKKKAYSPPPGGSMHESGRAFDLALGDLNVSLRTFWDIAIPLGVTPIIDRADSRLSEAWHFDCRGSHQKIYDYYESGKADNFQSYTAMAASAIMSVGIENHRLPDQTIARIQSNLIRLGFDPGPMDGMLGDRTRQALADFGTSTADLEQALYDLEMALMKAYPGEYAEG
jgi:hypothetical protein